MSSTGTPYNLRWGIIATGWISSTFSKDILLDPKGRGVIDVTHSIVAVGSRSVGSAQKFIENVTGSDPSLTTSTKAYGTYAGVYNDPNVDVIYVGTPHTYHYENTKDALNAGKHVLCEKPFTFDLAELDELIALAKKKNLFLMEAVWTRFQPLAYKIQEVIFSGKYGAFKRMTADLSGDFKPAQAPITHRMLDPALGGGAILDLGPYPMVWTMLLAYQHPQNKNKSPPSEIKGTMLLNPRTKVDDTSSWIVQFPGVGVCQCTASMDMASSPFQTVSVHLEEAEIIIHPPTYAPSSFSIYPKKAEATPIPQPETFNYPIEQGKGMHWQADEVARCIRDGKLRARGVGWKKVES